MLALWFLWATLVINVYQWHGGIGYAYIHPYTYNEAGRFEYEYLYDILGYSGNINSILMTLSCLILARKYKTEVCIYLGLAIGHLVYYKLFGGFPFAYSSTDGLYIERVQEQGILYDHVQLGIFTIVVSVRQFLHK